MTGAGPMPVPALILAADHRARGLLTVENYDQYLSALIQALPSCDGILASTQPLGHLAERGAILPTHRTYLSVNRTGLAGSVFELDDRLVASVERAAVLGYTGIKHMTRIDLADAVTAEALELLGQVIERAAALNLDALIEPLVWRNGAIARDTDSIVLAAVIAHDMGAPVLKVPVPDVPAGVERQEAVGRVVASVGVPVLFLGGANTASAHGSITDTARDVAAGGGAGMAIGRIVYQDPSPASLAQAISDVVHGR